MPIIDFEYLEGNLFKLQRELTPRLKLKNNVSPTKVEKLFRELLGVDNLKPNGLITLSEFDVNTKNEKFLNALNFSFEFNKAKFTRYNYNTSIDNLYSEKFPLAYRFKVIDFLSYEQVNVVREVIIKMQNRKLFKNYSENRAAKIIAVNFQNNNANYGNSQNRNRQFLNNILHSGVGNKTYYYEKDLKLIKSYLLRQYLP